MKYRKYLVFAATILLAGAGAWTCDATVDGGASRVAAVQFADRPALARVLDESKGKLLVLNYWASWCANCKPELKSLADLQARYGDEDLRVICVAVDPPEDEMKVALVKFLYQESGAHYKQLIADETEVKKIMTIVDQDWLEIVPITYLIGADGAVIRKFVGSRAIRDLKLDIKRRLAQN